LCKDCVKTYYKPSIQQKVKVFGSNYYVAIAPSSEPLNIYKYNPKLETIEFLCFIASVASIWFGFSFLCIFGWFQNIFNWFFINYQAKKSITRKKNLSVLRIPKRKVWTFH